MKNKFIQCLEQSAADPARRRAALAEFTRQSYVLFCSALGVTVCSFLLRYRTPHQPHRATLVGLAAMALWLLVFQANSRRRALVQLDRATRKKERSPAAKTPAETKIPEPTQVNRP